MIRTDSECDDSPRGAQYWPAGRRLSSLNASGFQLAGPGPSGTETRLSRSRPSRVNVTRACQVECQSARISVIALRRRAGASSASQSRSPMYRDWHGRVSASDVGALDSGPAARRLDPWAAGLGGAGRRRGRHLGPPGRDQLRLVASSGRARRA